MIKIILKLLNTKYGELITGLIFGAAYFVIILDFILKNTQKAGALLGFYVAPAVICGLALVFVKLFRRWRENEQYNSILAFMILNTVILVISVLLAVSNLLYGV